MKHTIIEDERLLPCPFCTSTKVVLGRKYDVLRVFCTECMAEGPHTRDEEPAVEQWNKSERQMEMSGRFRKFRQRWWAVLQMKRKGVGDDKAADLKSLSKSWGHD